MGKRKRSNPLGIGSYKDVKDKASLVGCTIHMKGKDWGTEYNPDDAEKTYKVLACCVSTVLSFVIALRVSSA